MLNGLAGNDVLDPGIGNGDVANGGSGFDFVSYASCPICVFGITVTLDNVADDGPTGVPQNDNVKSDVEGALGTRGGDVLRGPATGTANTLVGYGGQDTLDGKSGNDSLSGGAGSDTLIGIAGNDFLAMVDGEAGNGDCGAGPGDRVQYDNGLETPANCETSEPMAATAASRSVEDPRSAAFRAIEEAISRQARAAGG